MRGRAVFEEGRIWEFRPGNDPAIFGRPHACGIITVVAMPRNFGWRRIALIAAVTVLFRGGYSVRSNQISDGDLLRRLGGPSGVSVKQPDAVKLLAHQDLRNSGVGLPAHLAFLTLVGKSGGQGSTSSEQLVQNGGFEEGGSSAPHDWFRDAKRTGTKGAISLDYARFHSGRASLKLQPNEQNVGDYPLAIAQVIPGAPYRGRKAEFSAYLAAEGGATANLGMLNFVRGRPSNLVTVSRSSDYPGWTFVSQVYDVPDDASVKLVITCFVTGLSGAAWFDDVSVRPYNSPSSSAPPLVSQEKLHASVEVNAGVVIRRIPRTLYGANIEWIWNGNGLWREQERTSDSEIVRLSREMGVSLIRYPGGHYADGYHWRDGVTPYEKRPNALHEAGKGDRSRLTLGTEEALAFAQQVGAELMITVNAATGTPQEAADWVRYVNAKSERVRYWEVGNELYIKSRSNVSIDASAYAARFLEFAQAMRAADPKIKLGAIGGENQGRYASVSYANWDSTLLDKAADQIDFLAVHDAYAPVLLFGDEGKDVRTIYAAMLAAPVLIARNLNTISKQIADRAPARADKIGIAVTEWGPLFQFDPAGHFVDHAKTLGSALFVASALKAFIESPRTDIANFFLLNDYSVLGWIGSLNGTFPPRPVWAPTARYYAFQLYTQHFGDRLVQSSVSSPTYDSETVGVVDAVKGVPYLDVLSSLNSDGSKLYVMAINKDFDSPLETSITLRGFKAAQQGTAWTLTGTAIDANTGTTPLQVPGLHWGRQAQDQQNSRFYHGAPNEVTLASSVVTGLGSRFNYRFPAHSVTSLVLARAP